MTDISATTVSTNVLSLLITCSPLIWAAIFLSIQAKSPHRLFPRLQEGSRLYNDFSAHLSAGRELFCVNLAETPANTEKFCTSACSRLHACKFLHVFISRDGISFRKNSLSKTQTFFKTQLASAFGDLWRTFCNRFT